MGQERKLFCCITQRQLKYLGQAIPKEELEDLSLSGRISGKRVRGTQRFTFIYSFKHLYQNPGQLWDAAKNRTNWKSIIVLEQSCNERKRRKRGMDHILLTKLKNTTKSVFWIFFGNMKLSCNRIITKTNNCKKTFVNN